MIYNGQTCLVDHWESSNPRGSSEPFNQPFLVNLTQALGIATNKFKPWKRHCRPPPRSTTSRAGNSTPDRVRIPKNIGCDGGKVRAIGPASDRRIGYAIDLRCRTRWSHGIVDALLSVLDSDAFSGATPTRFDN